MREQARSRLVRTLSRNLSPSGLSEVSLQLRFKILKRGRIPIGKEGKPFYVAGPYDDCDEIMEKIQKINGDWLIPV